MSALWFCLVALMLAVYVLLDGFDLGAGMLHLGRGAKRRRAPRRSVEHRSRLGRQRGLAARGRRHALLRVSRRSMRPVSAVSILPLMMVLWLLILRGIAVEFRGHVSRTGVGAAVGRGFLVFERPAGRSSSALRWAT